ncbi:hypothetical protein DERP_004123 [Dermatophagoides pteronyssinus]|uniref:Uncharacterized protein n=2 Tax=Dermatophagoides pteronyssinus TaxID=6956 RepID=A0ABQ8J8U7_DERPT|nr:GTP-binding protein ypt2-like [Dermatophagoides pteronyssinus]KAH9418797.1 hypothetical protein DERP_004123 [Dermatophagoides pteronyssinus]
MDTKDNGNSNSNNNNVYKILLLGDSNVGKTCIVQRFCDDSFIDGYISTIGIDFKQKMIKLDDDNDDGDENLIKLQLWDTAGQERFRALTTAYYRGAMGIIVVYDVTNLESFQHVQYWFKNIDENASPQVIKILVANKCDLDQNYQIVDHEQAKQLAKRLDVPFYECSCKNNLNIQNLFFDLCHRIHDQLEQNENMFDYDHGHINSMDIIKRLEDHQEQQRRSSKYNEQNSNTNTNPNNDDNNNGSTIRSCSNCVTNYYYNYTYNNDNNQSHNIPNNVFGNESDS